jgi:NTE family protein
VIAVDISAAPEGNQSSDSIQLLLQTFAIMGKSINSWELKEADIVVRPALVGVGGADFTSRRRVIESGRAAMQALLPQLRAAIEAKSK